MLEVSGGGAKMYVDSVDADFAEIYAGSQLAKETRERAASIVETDCKAHEPLCLSSLYASTLSQQVRS